MAKKESKKKELVFATKEEALEYALGEVEKKFGKGAIMKLGDEKNKMEVEVTPTGSLSLDIALGAGGIPKGRIIEIFGPESSGKTTIALHMVAEVQKRGGIAGYIDAEHALDPIYAKNLGVNINELYISQPNDGEEALEIAETMVRSGAIDIIIVDSVAALVPRAEIDGSMGESYVGLHARLMSQALRKLAGIINKTKCTVVFINQLREKIGNSYGPSETTTGGRALKFYASVRLDIRKIETIKIKEAPVGSRTKVKVAKNKIAPPFKIAEFDIIYGEGISKIGDILDLAEVAKIVKKGGAWYSYGDTKLGQGRENAKDYLKAHPEMCDEIENKVRELYELPPLTPPGEGEKKDEKIKPITEAEAEEAVETVPDSETADEDDFNDEPEYVSDEEEIEDIEIED